MGKKRYLQTLSNSGSIIKLSSVRFSEQDKRRLQKLSERESFIEYAVREFNVDKKGAEGIWEDRQKRQVKVEKDGTVRDKSNPRGRK